MTEYIYLLIDPRDNKPFYVGRTINPKRRLQTHIYYRNSLSKIHRHFSETQLRIQAIHNNQLKPILKVVDQDEDYWNGRHLEDKWMRDLLVQGYELTNEISVVGTYGSFRRVLYDDAEIALRTLSYFQKRLLRSMIDVGDRMYIYRGDGSVAIKGLCKKGIAKKAEGNHYVLTDLGKRVGQKLFSKESVNNPTPTKLGG